ncbi:MAG: biotin transporter BioY [Sneathiella sp.]|nr:biotin transporter BioY [Sneathiella sp.]
MNTKDIVFIALFAALMAALGIFPPLTIPAIGVPITAQSMGVMLAGGILGSKRGALSMVLFLVLVGIGFPLLSGGRGGLGVFAGPSGGFLIGWIFAAYSVGFLTEKYWTKLNILIAGLFCILGGVVLLYAIGVPWVAYAASIPLSKAFIGSMGFVPGDLIKAIIAASIIVTVKRSYPLIKR